MVVSMEKHLVQNLLGTYFVISLKLLNGGCARKLVKTEFYSDHIESLEIILSPFGIRMQIKKWICFKSFFPSLPLSLIFLQPIVWTSRHG